MSVLHQPRNVAGVCGPLRKLIPPGFTNVEAALGCTHAPGHSHSWSVDKETPSRWGDEVNLRLIIELVAVDDKGQNHPRLQRKRRLAQKDIATGGMPDSLHLDFDMAAMTNVDGEINASVIGKWPAPSASFCGVAGTFGTCASASGSPFTMPTMVDRRY